MALRSSKTSTGVARAVPAARIIMDAAAANPNACGSSIFPVSFPLPVASRSTPFVFVSPFRHQRSLHGPGPVRARFRSSCSAACPWSLARVRRRRWRWRRVRPFRRRRDALRFRSSRAPTSSRFRLDSRDPILPRGGGRGGGSGPVLFPPLPHSPTPSRSRMGGDKGQKG